VAFTMAGLPATNQLSRAAYCDEVKLQGTWRPIGRRPTPANLFGPAPSLIRGEDLFTLKHYPGTSEPESPRRRESWRGGRRRQGALHLGSSSVIVPLESLFKAPHRAKGSA
jgi:hypothetical protein